MTGLSILQRFARPYLGRLSLLSLLSVLVSAATLAVPWLAGQFLGGAVSGDGFSDSQVIVLLVVVLIVIAALTALSSVVSARVSLRILTDVRLATYRRVTRLPLDFHESSSQGDLLAVLTYEVDNLSGFLTSTLAKLPSMVLTAAGSIVLLFLLDQRLALIIPVLLPVVFLLLKIVGRRLKRLGQQARDANAQVIACAEQDLEMLPATKAFAVEEDRQANFVRFLETSRSITYEHARIVAFLTPLVALIGALAAIGIIMLWDSASSDARSPAELFSILLYAALLTRPVGEIADLYGRYQWAKGALAHLHSVLSMPEEFGLPRAAAVKDTARGDFTLEDVHFAYPERPAVLQGLNLHLRAGETLAIIGANGIGKSTLIKLAMQFYKPASGRVLLDGKDVEAWGLQQWRLQFGLVPQRALLFNGSIRENIMFSFPGADDAALARALDLSQARAFVDALPEGLDTQIGDHGVRLSGGQRQRLALARALLVDPPILVLDEATSMFDLKGEEDFVASCQHAFKDRTVIIVTHRPASMSLADRVLEFSEGQLREPSG